VFLSSLAAHIRALCAFKELVPRCFGINGLRGWFFFDFALTPVRQMEADQGVGRGQGVRPTHSSPIRKVLDSVAPRRRAGCFQRTRARRAWCLAARSRALCAF